MAEPLLAVRNLDAFYGRAQILHGVSFEMGVEPETGGAARGVVAARPFEHAAAVVHHVRADVNLGIRPVDERAVHPDFACAEGHSILLRGS